jgi:Polyketide cyclase / dehydrase and lipid transport
MRAKERTMDFDLAITIRRPPEAVWPVLDDIQAYADAPGSPVPEMEKIPPGPVHVGTRWREVVRLLPGVTMTVWSEATAVEAGRRLEEDFRGPLMTGHLAYELEPAPAGCVLHQRETLTPHGPLSLVAGPMEGMLRPRLEHRLEEIRDLVESGASAPG